MKVMGDWDTMTALIRLPDFVTGDAFDWAIREATEKKQRDFSTVEFFPWKWKRNNPLYDTDLPNLMRNPACALSTCRVSDKKALLFK